MIGKRIKAIREMLGISQAKFGKEFGMTRSGVCMIEKGKRNPSYKVLQKIIDKFNVEPNRLFKVIILLSLLTLTTCAWASDFSEYSNNQIVEAIGKAENSIKYPYGIKSIDTKGDTAYARQICYNSVHNGRARWKKAGQPYDLITFIGLRYCPPKAHPLNSNWVKNVKFFLKKAENVAKK